MTCLHHASMNGNLEIIKLLVECGAKIDITDLKGFKPLHYACQFGKMDAVALLL